MWKFIRTYQTVLFLLFLACGKGDDVGPDPQPAPISTISEPIDLTDINTNAETGTLTGGYNAAGSFYADENGIVFLDDFVLGNAPGPVWYLSNNNGIGGGVRLGVPEISRGAHRIYTKQARDYNHLILWCEPFSVRIAIGNIPD